MFVVDTENFKIDMHRGDTGVIAITADTDYTFNQVDRAIFTIKDNQGTIVKEVVAQMMDNRFEVVFTNSDTDGLAPGVYEWDVRYAVSPIYSVDGRIVDGQGGVYTPKDPMQLNLRRTIGQI